MATPDFSKIWASESPLTPYTFSDDDYLDGWEFIGEIPPDRRMFDTWQKQADTKMQWLYSNTANWLRKNNTAYELGDIAFSPSLPSAMFLKCIEAGTTGATEPDYTGAEVGGTVQDGEVVWQYYDLLSGSGVPLGTILPYSGTGDTPPYGFLFFEGQAVSRTMYADYFDLVGTTYGEGDGENTFNLPNLIDAAMLNGSYTKTSYETAGSATFTAPKTGWYKITVKGGGGGGRAGSSATNPASGYGGNGGGEGGTSFAFEKMTAGQTASVVIGAGGTGGTGSPGEVGANGGNSTVTVNSNTYTGGGGIGGNNGAGGTGDIPGAPGGPTNAAYNAGAFGGAGGGAGGGRSLSSGSSDGTKGGGGAGGYGTYSGTYQNGSAGGDGYVTFEYIGVSMKYIGKVYDAPTPSSAQIDLSQYASDLAARLTREQTPAFNKRDVITTSGTYTAPVTGWYRITVKGGGGGGQGGGYTGSSNRGGFGGNEGSTTIAYKKMTAGDTATVTIGAGGTGGAYANTDYGTAGANGGNSSVLIGASTIGADGGAGGWKTKTNTYTNTIIGAVGGSGSLSTTVAYSCFGGNGGGTGGSRAGITPINAIDGGGGGGCGGLGAQTAHTAGGNGGGGYVWFEYFDPSLM